MKKILFIISLIIITIIPICAEPSSLNTEISSVYFGPHAMGFGLAPTGTNFLFYNSFTLFPKLPHRASFGTRLIFSGKDNVYAGGYHYATGTPDWIYKYKEIEHEDKYFLHEDSKTETYYRYFKPEASVNVYLSQGFGINPIEGSGSLFSIGLGFTSNYTIALECLNVNRGTQDSLFFDPNTDKYKAPFGPSSKIPAYPWLQDNRQTLSNNININFILNLYKYNGFGAHDGLRFQANLTYAPKWLGNTISMEFPTSDYFSFNTSLYQYLTLFVEKQDNGMNWLSIALTHSNSYNYIGGSIIPSYALPYDRLNQSFNDYLALTFNGPQFIAGDCYTDVTLALSNSCYFGYVLNEPSRTTHATEWTSSLSTRFHMRLFGFMHFSYDLGYTIYSGIHTTNPGFYHKAKVNFYISL